MRCFTSRVVKVHEIKSKYSQEKCQGSHFCGSCSGVTDKTGVASNDFTFVCFSIQQHVLGSWSQIFAWAGLCLQSYLCVCVFIKRCVCSPTCSDLRRRWTSSLTFDYRGQPSSQTCQRCPCSKWDLTWVSSPAHTLCRWRCNQLSRPLNGPDWSSTLKQTGEQDPNCFFYQDIVRDNNLVFTDFIILFFLHLIFFYISSFEYVQIQLTGY